MRADIFLRWMTVVGLLAGSSGAAVAAQEADPAAVEAELAALEGEIPADVLAEARADVERATLRPAAEMDRPEQGLGRPDLNPKPGLSLGAEPGPQGTETRYTGRDHQMTPQEQGIAERVETRSRQLEAEGLSWDAKEQIMREEFKAEFSKFEQEGHGAPAPGERDDARLRELSERGIPVDRALEQREEGSRTRESQGHERAAERPNTERPQAERVTTERDTVQREQVERSHEAPVRESVERPTMEREVVVREQVERSHEAPVRESVERPTMERPEHERPELTPHEYTAPQH